MSKIQEELATATEVTPSKRKNETITDQDYLKRLAVAILELPEAEWNKISKEAQDWYNDAADAIDKGAAIPAFPDLPKAEGASRRRGASTAEASAQYEPKEGDEVKITTKRGKTVEGKLAVVDAEGYQLESGEEFGLDVTVEPLATQAGNDGDPQEDTPAEPSVGATVQVETKRGKVIMGKILELDDEGMLLVDSTGAEHDITIASTKSIVVKATAETKPAGGRRGAAKEDPKKDDKPAAPAKGVSVTNRVREVMADSLVGGGKLISKDDLAKKLKAEGLDVKQSTSDLTYNDFVKVTELLRDRKLID